jgi:murein DD-endopeptidase MepM/ murein hydrolase activator NlpD
MVQTRPRPRRNLEAEIAKLESDLATLQRTNIWKLERRVNQLLELLDEPAATETKGDRLRERLVTIAVTAALTMAMIKSPSLDLFDQAPKQEQLSPRLSPSLDPNLDKPEVKPAPSLDKPTTKPESISLPKLMQAIATQESGGRTDLQNSDSGASGKWQIMPSNIPSWSMAALGREVSHSEFMRSPQIQHTIAKHRLSLYLNQEKQPGRSEEEVIRRVASLWYSGRAHLWDNTKPQYSNGRRYPSIAQYTKSVWNLYKDVKIPKYSSTKEIIATWPEQLQKDPNKGDTIAGYKVTSPKGMRIHPVTGEKKMHTGVDVAMPTGTPLYAIADGVIEYGHTPIAGLYGSFTSDEFPGLAFKLVHLSKSLDKPGTKREVKQGEIIGWSGGEPGDPNAGRSTGAHLHLGIKGLESGNWLRVRSGWLHWFITGEKPVSCRVDVG